MSNTYQIYLISDSTGETLDRIFLALKAQFNNIQYYQIELLKLKISYPKFLLLNLKLSIFDMYYS